MSQLTHDLPGDAALRAVVSSLRSHRRRRLALEGVAAVAIAVIVAVVIGAVLAWAMGGGPDTVSAIRIAGYSLVVGVMVRWLVWPMLRSVDDPRLALYAEEIAPGFDQSLLSAVEDVSRPAALRTPSALGARVRQLAVARATDIGGGATIERPRVRRALVDDHERSRGGGSAARAGPGRPA